MIEEQLTNHFDHIHAISNTQNCYQFIEEEIHQ